MASNGVDPTTGHPIFPTDDPSELGPDLTEVAAYAAFRGTRLRGSTPNRVAWSKHVLGLAWFDTVDLQPYISDGSGFVWAGGPSTLGVAKASSTQNVADNSNAVLTFASALVEKGVTFGSNGFTVLAAGLYRVHGAAEYDADADGNRRLLILVNGSSAAGGEKREAALGTSPVNVHTHLDLQLSANDTVTLRAYHSAGNTLAVTNRMLHIERIN